MKEKRGNLQEKLEQEMLERLRFEWERIHYELGHTDHKLAARLTMPSIIIMDMKSCLGQWVNDIHEIRLSRSLLMNGRWDSICEVLRHEVAHQMAATFPEHEHRPPHGEIFQHCCIKRQANPRASGGYRTLEERIWENTPDEPDKIMGKVKKLMGLAASKNRFEAASAAAKANQFISRYNIDIINHDKPREFESIFITDPVLKRTQAAMFASMILKEFYFVQTVWVSSFMPQRGKVGYMLELTGTETNLKIADYVFHYILKYAESSWLEYKKNHPDCRSRSGYMTGVVAGFREKLASQKKKFMEQNRKKSDHAQDSDALICMEDSQLLHHFHMRHPRVAVKSISHSTASRSAYESGKEKGRHLNVAKAITSHGESTGGLISG
ncbi:SprT-like family protein [Desulfocicer vacuolatum DSM 3385]|uniref:SprT-like family protein n=1 Tax=Desulfocicer vacuolatum DSM 3385 TaxID=1121400 RepID=A0A1W2BVA4_9BACT|nr:SprT-like domain-containing protein [Desulfocicer vacuolatum]SMC76656.1 SprT-like family protein [Desulfocicer vacuolatum DSM 3385]